MATGFSLTIGYISGSTWRGGEKAAYEELEATAKEYIHSPRFTRSMTTMYGKLYKGEKVAEYTRIYRAKTAYNPISYHADEMRIFISCSGGGASRELKEMVAMRLCAEIISELAWQGIPVCLSVA